jgi:hypothetical protein
MFGSHYFSRSSLVQSLHGAISDSFWQVERMHARRDDWDVDLAKMLTWQVGYGDKPAAYAPFCGEPLYALIMFGKLAPLLDNLPTLSDVAKERDWLELFDPEDYRSKHASQNPLDQAAWQQLKTVRSLMSALSDRLIEQLDLREVAGFRRFWTRTRTAWLEELRRWKEYEKLKQ